MNSNNILTICKLANTSKPEQIESPTQPDSDQQDLDMIMLNTIDLDQITLSSQETKFLEKFVMRKNYAMALSKKKEPIYWGDIIPSQEEQGNFLENISKPSMLPNEYGVLEENPSLLSKRILLHFLSEDGMLYSMGKDTKKYGLLGLGAQYEISSPCPNNSLIDFRISKIAMGLSHCCALTSGGQLYAWGTGQNGQLCLNDDTMFTNVPKLVPNSKSMNILSIHCSSYYTLILNNSGQVSMYGTLKGFAKFLFDSPSKDSSRSSIENKKFRLELNDEVISKVALGEKSFLAYSEKSANLYFINENLESSLIIKRDLKQLQFLNNGKYLIAQDKNNILIILSQSKTDNTWKIIKEINLIQEFHSSDIELLPQDSSVSTKKAQQLQLLTFVVNQNQNKVIQNLNSKYYKTFLTNQNGNNSSEYTSRNAIGYHSRQRKSQSPFSQSFSSLQDGCFKSKLQIKLDNIVGNAFSARKDRSTSSKIKERARKLHQSLSPISRFPIINNLVEKIKQHHQQLNGSSKSPPKFQFTNSNSNMPQPAQLNSPQYNMLFKSFNLACQISSIGANNTTNAISNDGQQSDRQQKFMSKAEKIRQELSKKTVTLTQISHKEYSNRANSADNNDLIEIATPDVSRNSHCQNGCNLPLQIPRVKNDNMPLQRSNIVNQSSIESQNVQKNLSCIFEDKENNSTTIVQDMKFQLDPFQKQGEKQRPPSMALPPHTKLLKPQQDILNLDTISDISARDSYNRFSCLGSELTHTNNYKILVMNARNVLEKKIFQYLMCGFNAIKYLTASKNTTSSETVVDDTQPIVEVYTQENVDKLVDVLLRRKLNITASTFKQIAVYSLNMSDRRKGLKKLGQIFKSKQDQYTLDAIRKIQLSIRFKKLQRLNINLFVNCFTSLLKKQSKQDIRWAFNNILDQVECNKMKQLSQTFDKMEALIITNKIHSCFAEIKKNMLQMRDIKSGLKTLKKVVRQISFRRDLNAKSKVLYQLKKNLIIFKDQRISKLSQVIDRLLQRKLFMRWQYLQIRRKVAVQQSIFLKIFIQDKIKQIQYHTLVKLLNHNNHQHQNHSKQSQTISEVKIPIHEILEVSQKEVVEKSIQNTGEQDLDIEETQLDDDYYYCGNKSVKERDSKPMKVRDMPKQMGKEFSFEKREMGEMGQLLSSENNQTAHFNKNNMLSRGKEFQSVSEFKDGNQRPHYHCHYTDQLEDAPEAFKIDFNCISKQSLSLTSSQHKSNKENQDLHSQQSSQRKNLSMKMHLQNEISPTNNFKHYQRQNNICKNYEQSDPLELPMQDDMAFTDYAQYLDVRAQDSVYKTDDFAEQAFIASVDEEVLRESQSNHRSTHVVPFNPPEDSSSEKKLTLRIRHDDHNSQRKKAQPNQVFQNKKDSVKSVTSTSTQGSKPFINNYFSKLSAQNSITQDKKSSLNSSYNNSYQPQQQQYQSNRPQQQIQTQKQYSHLDMPRQQPQMNQTSFITNNNNIDIMHFHTSSDTSFVFFDDNFWRDSTATRISGLSRMGHTGMMTQSSQQSQQSNPQQQHPHYPSQLHYYK